MDDPKAWEWANRYGAPDGGLSQAIQELHGVKAENIITGCGSGELLSSITIAMLIGDLYTEIKLRNNIPPGVSVLFSRAIPPRSAAARVTPSAASKFPRTTTMRAPCATACASLPSATFPSGTTTRQPIPAATQYAAAEAEVFPVDAQTATLAPASTAFATATTIPRSLNEQVGFAPS